MKYKKILDCFAQTKGLHLMGSIKLPSGNISPLNLDLVRVFSEPKHLEIIGKALAREIKKMKVDLIAGVATAAIPLAASASYWSGLPFVYVRKKPDLRTREVIQGSYKKGQRAVLIDDIIGAGGTKKAVLENVKGKLVIKDILVLIDAGKNYQPNWRSWTKIRKIRLKYFITWTELTRYLIKKGFLDKQAGFFLLKFLKNQKWHKDKKLWQEYLQWKKQTRLKTGEPLV